MTFDLIEWMTVLGDRLCTKKDRALELLSTHVTQPGLEVYRLTKAGLLFKAQPLEDNHHSLHQLESSNYQTLTLRLSV